MNKVYEKVKSCKKPFVFECERTAVMGETISKGHLAEINRKLMPKIIQNQQELVNSEEGLKNFIVK